MYSLFENNWGQTDGRTDGRMDGRTNERAPLLRSRIFKTLDEENLQFWKT